MLLSLLTLALLASPWAAAQGVAAVRFVHLSPDAPRVDVLADSLSLLRDVDYGDTTGFVRVTPGEHTMRVFPHRLPDAPQETEAPEQQEDGAEALRLEPVTLVVDLDAGEYYTVLLSGFYEPPPDEDRRGFMSIDVEPPEAVVTLQGPRGYTHEASGDQLLRDLQPGDYTLRVEAEGYQSQERSLTVQPFRTTVTSATLQSEASAEEGEGGAPEEDPGSGEPAQDGTADTDGAAGAEGGTDEAGETGGSDGEEEVETPAEANVAQEGETWDPMELQIFDEPEVALPPAGDARVRVVHASPLAPEVDVLFVREEEESRDALAEELSYPNASASTAVASGRGQLLVVVSGSRNPLYEASELTLEAGVVYSLYLTTAPDQNGLTLVPTVSAVLRYQR